MLGYIDPQTGSMIWQGVVAAVLGAGVAIKVFWKRIVGLFSGRSRREQAASNGASGSPASAASNGDSAPSESADVSPTRPQTAAPSTTPSNTTE